VNIFVTGASGFVGATLCRALLARSHAVRAAIRHPDKHGSLPPKLQTILLPDIAGDYDRRALLEDIDVVVHLAGIAHRAADEAEIRRVNVSATVRLAEAAAGLVRRFVFLSSVKVHGEDSGSAAYSESSPLLPQDLYGKSKLEAEQALTELADRKGLELVIVRPPLVYGPGVKANFLRLLGWIDAGRPLPFGSVHNRRTLIGLGNLADAVAHCAEHPQARGPYLVGDEEIVSTPELAERIARALGRKARLFPVPPALLRIAGSVTGHGGEIRRLTGNLVVDATHARQALGWRPLRSLDQGLEETARWYKSVRG
jgi:nucleoside-diphosphate-sugar epimerase